MNDDQSQWQDVRSNSRARRLEARWQRLCATWLPRAAKDSFWRYDTSTRRHQPRSGWKLHISATILSAPTVLSRVGPFLAGQRVPFKAPRSLSDVARLNAGLNQSYSQIGKIITVYPRSDKQAVFLAQQLDRLTRGLPAPNIPFDLRFSDTGNVYYRYGAFGRVTLDAEIRPGHAVYTPAGELVPDNRHQPKPDWVNDPLAAHRPRSRRATKPVNSAIRVMKVLAQRGKGGVYEAIDFRGNTPQLCLLKEGRKHGELSWDGRDGAWRVRHEERVLKLLRARGVPVPRVDSSFTLSGNHYLVMEYLNGESLHDRLARCRQRFTLAQVLDYAIQLADFLEQMHAAGWVWRDCKPRNLIVTAGGRLVPIDFEGAAPINRPDIVRWGTAGFAPPEWRQHRATTGVGDDLYALGSMLYLLITGRVYEPSQPIPIGKLRRSVPSQFQQLITSLLQVDPAGRPAANLAAAQLNSIWRKHSLRTQHPRSPDLKAA